MATSAVPAAIDAFLSILTAAAATPGSALAGVSIFDGPPTVNLSGRMLFVGHQPDAEATATIEQRFASAGARTRDEDFVLACYAEASSGDTDMQAARQAAFDLLAAVETELRATTAAPTAPTLNGTVLWAHLTAGALQQAQTPDGARAGVAFFVTCRARI